MISVATLFLLLAGIVFLGYILNALFYRLKVSNIIALLLIGLLIGPVFNLVNTGPTSIVSQISPFITAIAIAFILFDVGMNIRLKSLRDILLKTSKVTFITSMLTGAAVSLILYYFEGWGVLISLMAGFALSGTSSITLPSLFKVIKVNENLKTALAFQSVFNDIFSLVVPLIFFNIISAGTYSLNFIAGELGRFLIGSLILGLLFASFWVFVLRRFRKHSSEYSWMLTLTIVLAVYGSAEYLQFNGAMAAFIFGVFLINIPDMPFLVKSYVKPVFVDLAHVRIYQKEITFFVSTFFFVYLGMLFDPIGVPYGLIALAVAMTLVTLAVRFLTSGMLKGIVASGTHARSEMLITRFYVAQGLVPAIIATLPATIGLEVPNLVDIMFLMILLTNAMLSAGLYLYAKRLEKE